MYLYTRHILFRIITGQKIPERKIKKKYVNYYNSSKGCNPFGQEAINVHVHV